MSDEHAVRRRRSSILALMALVGLGISSWVTRTPAVRDAVGASTAEMGMILFGLSVGSMAGVIASGRLVARVGTRPVAVAGSLLIVAGVAVVAAGSGTGTAVVVFLGLLLFGLGGGLGEIALNVEGAEVEAILRRPVLPVLHGCFSLGTVVGGLLGMGAAAVGLPVLWHLGAVAVVLAGIAAWAFPGLPAGVGVVKSAPGVVARDAPRPPSVWRDRTVVLIGIIVLAMAFAEGSANDWLALLIVDGHGVAEAYGSLIYVGFAAMMTVGRFAGSPLVARMGSARMMAVSTAMAIAGIVVVAYSTSLVLAGVAVALWGLGASLGFPVAISAAGSNPDRSAERVSAVATSGYIAFLVGPPLLGFLGEAVGLQQAMLAVVLILVVALAASLGLIRAQAGQAIRQRGTHGVTPVGDGADS